MPMLESSVAMITSQHPSRAAFPAKHRPDTTPTRGTSPLSRPNRAKAMVSSPDTWARQCPRAGHRLPRRRARGAAETVPPTRTAGPSSGGPARPGSRPGRCSRRTPPTAARRLRSEKASADLTETTDEPVGRGVADQILLGSPVALGRDNQGAVLDERPRFAQVIDVFPGAAMATVVAAPDSIRPGPVQGQRLAARVPRPNQPGRHRGPRSDRLRPRCRPRRRLRSTGN